MDGWTTRISLVKINWKSYRQDTRRYDRGFIKDYLEGS